jgi:hypothetical protein
MSSEEGFMTVRWSPRGQQVPKLLGALTFALAIGSASACMTHQSENVGPADATLITQEQIDSCHAVSAFEAVDRLHPLFLAGRGKMSLQPGTAIAMPNVYVDNQFYGDVSVLHSISAASIESIRLYSASDAQQKFGRGNEAGVVGIFTKH